MGHVVFDPEKHALVDEPLPRRDDAKKRLDFAIRTEYRGEANPRLRALAKTTWEFVQPVVHEQTDNRVKAIIAADATIHVVKVLTALFPTPTGRWPEDAYDAGDEEEEDWGPSDEDQRFCLTGLAEGKFALDN